MSDTITIRAAERSDAADLMVLDNMSSHGLSLAFWQHACTQGAGDDPLVIGRSRFMDDASAFGWKNAFVAEIAGMIAGGVTAYEMEEIEDLDWIKKTFPAFLPPFELFSRCTGDWFIDSLAVYPERRGKGVARRLMAHALQLGRKRSHTQASLVVEDLNATALRLYFEFAFTEVDRLPFAHQPPENVQPGMESAGNWLLMRSSLDQFTPN